MYAPSAISARGGKFRTIPGTPGYVTVSVHKPLSIGAHNLTHLSNLKPTEVDDPWKIVKQFKDAAVLAKKAGFDGVECAYFFFSSNLVGSMIRICSAWFKWLHHPPIP